MILALLLACAPKPSLGTPIPGGPSVAYTHAEEVSYDGLYCSLEAEQLRYNTVPLWGGAAPADPATALWCKEPVDHAWEATVVAEGPETFSVQLVEEGCCPEVHAARCATYSRRTLQPVSLDAVDPRHAARHLEHGRVWLAAHPAYAGWSLSPDSFLLQGEQVILCASHGTELVTIPAR